jgi:predicted ABC-type exoprotein transport system permease subunit
MKIKLIENWKQCYKFLTVQLSVILGLIAAAYEYIPMMKDYLPEGWVKYAFIAVIVARIINQSVKDEQQ